MVSEAPDQKSLFKIVDKIAHTEPNNTLPEHSSSIELANRFGQFFSDKIVTIRNKLDIFRNESSPEVPGPTDNGSMDTTLNTLHPTSSPEVRKIIMESKTTSCKLDPVPTSFLKIIIDVLLPILTYIINLSFDEAKVPRDLKTALIVPLLKKVGMDPEILKNFRPVSNLSYMSKLLERVAARRLTDHMATHNLHETFQSAYEKFHSTESALLRIQSDILGVLDEKKCVLLVMLDLSSAFDTIDHSTLLSRLHSVVGLSGKALKWFKSYIEDRTQCVTINGIQSSLWEPIFGVPQGSVLGPLLFIIYMAPLGMILRSLGIQYHFYADDSQIYVSFHPDQANLAVEKIEQCVSLIKSWMAKNFLCLNEDKTEVLLIASKSIHQKLHIPHITFGNEKIPPSKDAKNIGFIFDHIMDCKKQVNSTCKSGWHHLRNIGRIRHYLDMQSTERLVHAFITSRLDINNALYVGLPDTLLNKLQRLQNAAARLIVKLPKHSHISSTLMDLHWLPVKQRIRFKILLTVFKALHGLSPVYIKDLLVRKPHSVRSMRSDNQNLLIVPRTATVMYGDRNFCHVGPSMWNELPFEMRSCEDLETFKRSLKTLLFKVAFN
jgi:hypothetical protein